MTTGYCPDCWEYHQELVKITTDTFSFHCERCEERRGGGVFQTVRHISGLLNNKQVMYIFLDYKDKVERMRIELKRERIA
jgi:hypothetical protein